MRRCFALTVLLATTSLATAAPMYRVTDLHTQSATWLTGNGTVVVIADRPDGTQAYSAVRNGHWSKFGVPAGAYIDDISDNGTVLAHFDSFHTFVQRPDGTRRTLREPAGADGSGTWYVNDAGTAAGVAVYGGVYSLATWPGTTAVLSKTAVHGVNGFANDGTALIDRRNKPGLSPLLAKDGVVTRLPGPTNLMAYAKDLNDRGGAAGEIGDAAAIWTPHSFRQVPPLPGQAVDEFNALNDSGYAVGHSAAPGISAVVWDGSGLVDLNTRIASAAGVRLEVAYEINDAGQILVQGTNKGNGDYFLLTPLSTPAATAARAVSAVPEPTALTAAAAAGVLLLGRVRNRHRQPALPSPAD